MSFPGQQNAVVSQLLVNGKLIDAAVVIAVVV
jgi:hypothetical protein